MKVEIKCDNNIIDSPKGLVREDFVLKQEPIKDIKLEEVTLIIDGEVQEFEKWEFNNKTKMYDFKIKGKPEGTLEITQ